MYLQDVMWENILIDILCVIARKEWFFHNTMKYIQEFPYLEIYWISTPQGLGVGVGGGGGGLGGGGGGVKESYIIR